MVKTLVPGCEPTKGSKYSAAIDLRSAVDITIQVGETSIIDLGICTDVENLHKLVNRGRYTTDTAIQETCIEFMLSHYIQLEPRSSLRAKGLIASTGIIDLDYTGTWKLIVQRLPGAHGTPLLDYHIKKGDRIAQALLMEHKSALFGIESTVKRVGGLGSTGI